MSIQNIFTNGVLIDINISSWTGEKQLTAEDLGIDSNTLPDSFRLGKKSLIPPKVVEKFRHLDYLARKTLITKSYIFPFGSARFLPKKIFEEFNVEFDVIKTNFEASVNDLIANYDTYRREMRTEFINAAKEAYERLTKINGVIGNLKIPRTITGSNGKPTTIEVEISEDQYINEFLDRIEKDYPKVENLAKKFKMDYVPFQMELPDLTEATIDDVAEENTKINLLQDAYQKKMRKTMEEYAESLVKQNRDRANTVIQTMTNNLKKKTRFTETTYNMILNMISTFKTMNIVQDNNLEAALETFKTKYLDPNSSKQIRESDKIQANMLEDFTTINNIIQDAAEIQALADSYKQKIKI